MAYKNIGRLFTFVVVLPFIMFGVAMSTLAQEEATPEISKTTGPVHGMSVEDGANNKPYRVLWPGHYIRQGTVESVRGDMVKVNTGELVSRFLSAREIKDKGLPPLKKGDQLQLVLNDQNLVIDYHLVGQEIWHRIVRGRLVQPLPVGHEWAVILTEPGEGRGIFGASIGPGQGERYSCQCSGHFPHG